MLESQLERKFCKRIKETGSLPLKFVSPGMAGVPDRIILIPGGKVRFAELKKPGGHLRPLQAYTVKKFRKLGFTVHVVDSEAEIQKVVQEIEEEIP